MYERSEVCTKAQFSSYKSQAKQHWINKLKVTEWEEDKDPQFDQTTTTTAKGVGSEFAKYYKMLYSQKVIDQNQAKKLLMGLGKQKILRKSSEKLDEWITKEEVQDVMENLPIGKSAGPNRIPNAMYKYLSSYFAADLAEVLNDSIALGKLPKHFMEGDISMLYKKKDREDPRNYRPITLLNSDYKIFTRILAIRMKNIVHEFVSETQKGFTPNTFISDGSMLMRMIEAYLNEDWLNRKGMFIFLDMEKAFDRVSYEFTMRGLEKLGFGDRFRKWVGMMYNNTTPPKRRMYVNGYYSDWFEINSGVAQGCPLSPLLFLIVVGKGEAARTSLSQA